MLLYETWARPDKISAGYFPDLASMQDELRSSYRTAATDFGLQGWAPVGDAFMEGIASGLANNPATTFNEGPVSLWNSDQYHASAYGSYLAATVFYAKILGGDPRALPVGAGSAVAGLGLNSVYADQLQEIAYKLTQPVPEPSVAMLCSIALLLVQSRRPTRKA